MQPTLQILGTALVAKNKKAAQGGFSGGAHGASGNTGQRLLGTAQRVAGGLVQSALAHHIVVRKPAQHVGNNHFVISTDLLKRGFQVLQLHGSGLDQKSCVLLALPKRCGGAFSRTQGEIHGLHERKDNAAHQSKANVLRAKSGNGTRPGKQGAGSGCGINAAPQTALTLQHAHCVTQGKSCVALLAFHGHHLSASVGMVAALAAPAPFVDLGSFPWPLPAHRMNASFRRDCILAGRGHPTSITEAMQ